MSAADLLLYYQQALDLTRLMRASVDSEDWDRFMQLEQQRRVLFETAKGLQIEAGPEVQTLIRIILDEDQSMMTGVQAWMDELRPVLSQMANVRRLGQTYQQK